MLFFIHTVGAKIWKSISLFSALQIRLSKLTDLLQTLGMSIGGLVTLTSRGYEGFNFACPPQKHIHKD